MFLKGTNFYLIKLEVFHVGFIFPDLFPFDHKFTPRPTHFHVIFAQPNPAHSTPNPAQSTGILMKEKF
jgi:hypothetical protein